MGRVLTLPSHLERYSVHEDDQPGWEGRGDSYLDARGVVLHHTAFRCCATWRGTSTLIDGRPDLAGPLCNVQGGANGAGGRMIASGRANHAGAGGWRGLYGNSSVVGIEWENDGVGEAWSSYTQVVGVCAACLDCIGAPTEMLCGHKEWTSRKIDPAGIDMNQLRRDVAAVRAGGGLEEFTMDADAKAAFFTTNVRMLEIEARTIERDRRKFGKVFSLLKGEKDRDAADTARLEEIQRELADLRAEFGQG